MFSSFTGQIIGSYALYFMFGIYHPITFAGLLAISYLSYKSLKEHPYYHEVIKSIGILNPDNTIVAFDLHGVLFKTDPRKIFKLAWQHKKAVWALRYMFYPRFVYDVSKLIWKKATAEEYINLAKNKYHGLRPYIPLVIALANAQKPIQSTINFIKTLKAKGYQLHLFSNIGPTLLEPLKKQHRELFSYFDAIKIPSASDKYLAKPKGIVFKQYMADYNPENKHVVFIDNNQHNIHAALSAGLIGIQYINPTQLGRQLELLGMI